MHFFLGTSSTSLQNLDNLSFFVHSYHIYDMHMMHYFIVSNPSSSLCCYYSRLFFLFHFARFYIVIIFTSICVMFANLSLLCLWCWCCYDFVDLCNTKSAYWASTSVIPSSHNIVASLCCCNVICFNL
jgi:hypothetical protein